MNTGQLITKARLKKGMNRPEFARYSGLSYTCLSKLETNKIILSDKFKEILSHYLDIEFPDIPPSEAERLAELYNNILQRKWK